MGFCRPVALRRLEWITSDFSRDAIGGHSFGRRCFGGLGAFLESWISRGEICALVRFFMRECIDAETLFPVKNLVDDFVGYVLCKRIGFR